MSSCGSLSPLTTFLYFFSSPTHCYYFKSFFLTYTLLFSQMYADKQSRGGILEPPGICEVKYRSQEQKIAMHRLDPTLIELDDLLVWLTPNPILPPSLSPHLSSALPFLFCSESFLLTINHPALIVPYIPF